MNAVVLTRRLHVDFKVHWDRISRRHVPWTWLLDEANRLRAEHEEQNVGVLLLLVSTWSVHTTWVDFSVFLWHTYLTAISTLKFHCGEFQFAERCVHSHDHVVFAQLFTYWKPIGGQIFHRWKYIRTMLQHSASDLNQRRLKSRHFARNKLILLASWPAAGNKKLCLLGA